MSRCFNSLNFSLGFILSAAVVAMAAVSFFWTPYPANGMQSQDRLKAPSLLHPMGTDQYGRDIFSRVMAGAGNSILVGLMTVTIGLSAGVTLGLICAFRRGWVDEVTMRLCDLLYGFPAVLTAILITSVLGPSVVNAMLAIGIFYIPIFARLTRAAAGSVWQREFILAARAGGVSEGSIAVRHVLPNILATLVVQTTVQFAVAILAEAGLSYLGLGTQPPHPSWGRMLYEAQTFMELAPWMAIFPGAAIAVAVLGFNLLGDGLRDTLDPKMTGLGR
jgi:peptide/nickel transport system permease protein